MKITRSFFIACALFFIGQIQAQNADKIFRYSYLEGGGTARYIGGGGALGALGGDFTSISYNPAGLGAYIMNEIQLTPSLSWTLNKTNFADTKTNKSSVDFKINNLGLVITDIDVSKDYKSRNLAIGINTLANYSWNMDFSGTSNGTIGRRLEDRANSNFSESGLLNVYFDGSAQSVGLITDDNNDGNFLYRIDPNNSRLYKAQYIQNNGNQTEMTVSAGVNYQDEWYLGASVGVPFIRDQKESFYVEQDREGIHQDFFSMRFQEYEKTSGAGANLKIGAIYRVQPKLRLGASIHTPSFIFLKDKIYTTMWGDVGNVVGDTLQSLGGNLATPLPPISEFKYQMLTAPKLLVSAAYLIKNKGFLSTDIEYVHYPMMQYFVPDGSLDINQLNDEITDLYKGNINIRTSAEAIFKTYWRARLGIGMDGSPTQNSTVGNRYHFNVGGSYREQYFFWDAGLRITHSENTYVPNSIGYADEFSVDQTTWRTQLVTTIGIRF